MKVLHASSKLEMLVFAPSMSSLGLSNGEKSSMAKPDDLKGTKSLMGALVRMKPKPHDDMKVGKAKPKRTKLSAKRVSSSNPKNA